MRRVIATFVATVAGLVVLLSFKTAPTKQGRPVALGTTTPGSAVPPASSPPPQTSTDESGSVTTPAPTPTQTAKPAPSTGSSATKTVTGAAMPAAEGDRLFGMVQVRITITNGRITAATALDYPQNDPHSSEISAFAIPALSSEVLAKQGANIDVVSGATITSDAYARSVQAALDAAKA